MQILFKTVLIRALLAAVVVAAFIPALAQAQNTKGVGYVRALDLINRTNDYRPEQSPKHEKSKEIFSDRVIDKTNRVVGEVRDVVLDKNGVIQSLDIDFNRLRLGTDRMMVNYRQLGIRPVSNGYKMSYTDDQIEELVPELLASIDTAAGTDEDVRSLKKIVGQKISAKDGRVLGSVKDVLFDSLGGRAELLFVSMNYRGLRGETLALPFSEADFKKNGFVVKNVMADAMIEYAKEK